MVLADEAGTINVFPATSMNASHLIMDETKDSYVWPIPIITSAFRREYRRNYPPLPEYFDDDGKGSSSGKTAYSVDEFEDG